MTNNFFSIKSLKSAKSPSSRYLKYYYLKYVNPRFKTEVKRTVIQNLPEIIDDASNELIKKGAKNED
ncbi:hypothetical protein SAMN05216262_10660 [Colwellia chukchiensis]|uniref:Uncharacterized protein n=1 Tax=Colwellia chukchiensis TaxID=641665 RepID=A0A1H7MMK8_9GAMM|nr:hypothetical protein SAMN05216262_10660 [Colwellia chukchiensis]